MSCDNQQVCDGLDEDALARLDQLDGCYSVGLVLEANELRVWMCVVPEIQRRVNDNEGVVELSEQTQMCRDLGHVCLLKDLLGYVIAAGSLKRLPGVIEGGVVVVGDALANVVVEGWVLGLALEGFIDCAGCALDGSERVLSGGGSLGRRIA